MNIKDKINADLKKTLLSGDKQKAGALKVIKSAILDMEIEKGKRENGLSDEEMVSLLQKEAKKRRDTAEMYGQAGDATRQENELGEAKLIESYLPEQMDQAEIEKIIDDITAGQTIQVNQMGQIIGEVKQGTKGRADGATIARLVKERVSQ